MSSWTPPSSWQTTSTAELIREGALLIGDGYRAKNSEFVRGGGLPFVRVGDVTTRVETSGRDELPLSEREKYEPKVSRTDDSLITMKGTVGRVARVSADTPAFVYSPQISFWRVLDRSRLSPGFVGYWLRSPAFTEQAIATKSATDMADYINLRDQRLMRISLPPIETQRQIASILCAFDELIEIYGRRIAVLEDLAHSLYREWFVRFRFPGNDGCAVIDSEVGQVPEGWSVRPLGDVSRNLDRRRRPLSKAHRATRPGKYPYYGAAKLIDHIDGWIFDGEHLLFAEDGSVTTREGFPVLQLVEGKFWANNHTHILQGDVVSTRYLYLATSRLPIAGYVTGAAQPKITQANLKRIPVLVGPESVHAAFDRAVAPLLDEWQFARVAIECLARTRNLLLPRLVTGRLDISGIDLGDLLPAEEA